METENKIGSVAQLAEELGVSRTTIYSRIQALQKKGIPITKENLSKERKSGRPPKYT